MTAEHKNKDPFDFSPFATLWMATNHMPHCRDHSNAIYRRAEVLSFNREFKGDKADTDLSNKLIKELPGIFKMATDAIAGVFIVRLLPAVFLGPIAGVVADCKRVARGVGQGAEHESIGR